MGGILRRLTEAAREGVSAREAVIPLPQLEERLAERPEPRPFREALRRPNLSVIAEFKRRSPSAGEIRPGADLGEMVAAYERGGAAALSILTDEAHFGGSLADLATARSVCDLPILRKDFIVDRYQLMESAVGGADAVLLIVAALGRDELAELYTGAAALDLDVLVEVHDESELEVALEIDADVIGINNRDLHTFEVSIDVTTELMRDVPAGKTVVSESGISSRGTLDELDRIGVDAVLIGEALMRAPDPEALVEEMTAVEDSTREHPL